MASDGPGCEMAKTRLACSREVGAHLLMCREHWWQVSRPTQQLVYATLAGGGVLSPEYLDAVQQAADEVLRRNPPRNPE